MTKFYRRFQSFLAGLAAPLPRDLHLANCELAKAGDSDATLACRECGRAKWQHGTRHDTCPSFSWINQRDITKDMAMRVRVEPGCPREVAIACAKLCDDFTHHSEWEKRTARETIAQAINRARLKPDEPL